MRKRWMILFAVFAVTVVMAFNLAWGQEKNLYVNKEVTAQIQALDPAFFSRFDVYSAGVLEAPTALLFDIKGDDYYIATRFWGNPLSEEQIIYAIRQLEYQSNDNKNIPFPPRALNIVNLKGQVVGYVYTGLNEVLMDRKKDGNVAVYPPRQRALIPTPHRQR